MSFNLYQINFDSINVINKVTRDKDNLPVEIENKLELFYDITSKLYYQKQLGRKGIRNLGDKIRYDHNLKNIFLSESKSILIKSTGNRISFSRLFIEAASVDEYDKIYFLIFTKELNNLSQIFDKTTTTLEDIKAQLNSLRNITNKLTIDKELYVLEVKNFPKHNFFKTNENYSKIYDKS